MKHRFKGRSIRDVFASVLSSGFGVVVLSGAMAWMLIRFFDVGYPVSKTQQAIFMPAGEQARACQLDLVVDGDTVDVLCQQVHFRLRLLGIDAPETQQAPWGEMSTQALRSLLPTAEPLYVVSHGADYYGRTLATIYLQDGQDVNLFMIQNGFAVAYDGENTPLNYYAAEQTARAQQLNIWSESGHHQQPALWRRYHK